jgi:hypothetical protein
MKLTENAIPLAFFLIFFGGSLFSGGLGLLLVAIANKGQ